MLKYEKEIIEALLNKYQKRVLQEKNNKEINREISLKPKSIFTKYGSNYDQDSFFNKAVNELVEHSFVSTVKKNYSDDIEKIVLKKENAQSLINYASNEYGIVPISEQVSDLSYLLSRYTGQGELTQYYCDQVINPKILKTTGNIDIETDANMLRLLDYVQNNKKQLYVREVSMLVFGSSKVLENQFYQRMCSIILSANGKNEDDDISTLLEKYGIIDVNQEILVKGNMRILFSDHSLDVAKNKEGISIMSSDIENIVNIEIGAENFMTIENKTAFHRMNNKNTVYMYLGGFANHHQEKFIIKLFGCIGDKIKYSHFGDIDIGGFKIHKDLVDSTGIDFGMYKMGISELDDSRYEKCLCELSDNDRENSKSLMNDSRYNVVVNHMLKNNIKLEQEIIALLDDLT